MCFSKFRKPDYLAAWRIARRRPTIRTVLYCNGSSDSANQAPWGMASATVPTTQRRPEQQPDSKAINHSADNDQQAQRDFIAKLRYPRQQRWSKVGGQPKCEREQTGRYTRI